MRLIDADALYNGTMKDEYFRFKEKDKSGQEAFAYSCAMQRLAEAPTIQPNAPRVMKMAEEVFALRFDDVVYVEMYPSRAIVSAIVVDSIPWIKDELGVLQIRCAQEPLANMDFAWYGRTWRCWTGKPTKEQREAVKWE